MKNQEYHLNYKDYHLIILNLITCIYDHIYRHKICKMNDMNA